MSLIKENNEVLGICKVTFIIPPKIAKKYKRINLVGDFNYWDVNVNPFQDTKRDGSKFISVELPINDEYKFKYLCDGKTWLDEPEANEFVPVPFTGFFDSMLKV